MKPSGFWVRQLFAAAAAASAACTTVPGITPLQSSASSTAPAVAVGNTWTYKVRDGFTGLERPGQRYSVTAVSGERVQVSVSRDGLNDELQVYDRQWNWLKRPATNLQSFDYSPPYQAFAFPLAPGKTWRARLTATDPADGRRFPVTIHGEVLGWERVKVPAGEFDSLKVRRNVFFDYWEHTVRGRSEIVETEWYAPAAKQAVRRETTSQYWSYLYGERDTGFLRVRGSDRDGGGPRFVQDDWLIYELISHSVR